MEIMDRFVGHLADELCSYEVLSARSREDWDPSLSRDSANRHVQYLSLVDTFFGHAFLQFHNLVFFLCFVSRWDQMKSGE